MTSTAHEPRSGREATLLDAVRASRRRQMEEQVRELELVVRWCAEHEVAEADAATVVERGHDTGLAVAGPGTPWVSEFAVIELATALAMTADAGRRYVGQVLEVHYRLPQLWARVTAGELPWWRAARIAEHTQPLPTPGAAHVDAHLAPVAHKVGVVLTERLCGEALDQYDPAQAEERRVAAAESRRVDVHLEQAGRHGIIDITATVDTADALDLQAALAHAAADLETDGLADSLDVRRSRALGV
ncbi:MAG TPA: HNH endonuclease, partial [Nocardioides sp.]|nr:HNH endonuclease [Nocardioides sp.]